MYSGNTQFNAQPQAGYSGMAAQPQPGQQPVIVNPVPVATNQVAVQGVNQEQFKLSPVVTKCPHCFQTITTTVETQCSCCACCVFCMTGLLIYLCIQCCRNKDFCCQDATHKCPNCGKDIAFYKAM